MIALIKPFKIEEVRDAIGVVGIASTSPKTTNAATTTEFEKAWRGGVSFLLSVTPPSVVPPANTKLGRSEQIAPAGLFDRKVMSLSMLCAAMSIMPLRCPRKSYQ